MKKRRKSLRLPIVNVHIPIDQLQHFYETLLSLRLDRIRVYLNLLLLATMFTSATHAQTVLTGGSQKVVVTSKNTNNNEATVTLVNGTEYDMYDLRIILKDGKMSSYDLQGKNGALATSPVQPNSASVHVKFSKAVNNTGKNNTVTVTFKSTSPNYDPGDSITVIPTDTLGADILVDRNLNPVQTVVGANNPQKAPEPVKVSGGKTAVKTDGSNFPSVTCKNTSGQDECDMRIENARNKNGDAVSIDSVFVNNVKCTGSGFGTTKVHVFFPCVADGGTFKLSVKYHGNNQVITCDLIPTNKDSVNIGSAPVKFEPLNKSNGSSGGLKVGKGIKITGGSPGGKVGFTGENNTKQNIHDIIVQAFDSKKKPIKIKKVKVNGQEWPIDPTTSGDSTVVHADKGTNPPVTDGSKFPVEVDAKDPKAVIDSIHITLTDSLHNMIQTCNYNQGLKSLLIPNNYSGLGLSGRSVHLLAINESCSPISQLIFSTPDPGITVEASSSSLPSVFDSTTQILTFPIPIAVGQPFDFTIRLNALVPLDTTINHLFTEFDFFYPGSDPFYGDYWWTNTSCAGASNGTIDFTMLEGVPPFTFLWSNGATTEDLQNLSAGTYTLTVTSPSGCMQKEVVVGVDAPTPIKPFASDPGCNGSSDGMIELIKSQIGEHGSIHLETFWIYGMPTNKKTGLPAGNYPVMITDDYGCINAGSVSLSDPLPVMITGTVTNATCSGSNTGSIQVTASGGNLSYSFKWNNGNTSDTRTSLKAGSYTATATDGLGCTVLQTFNVIQPSAISIGFSKTNILCGGANTGKITANPTGGVSPYLYSWSNGNTTKTNKNLFAGTYTVTVTDANGCTKTKTTSLSEPPPLMMMVNQVGPNAAMANVAGGVPPYTFQWNTIPVQTTPLATGLLPGQPCTVTVFDMQQCSKSFSFIFGNLRMFMDDPTELFSLKAYPNPASGHLQVEFTNASDGIYSLYLSDETGRILYQETVTNPVGETHVLDVSKFASGVYSLKAEVHGAIETKKIIIIHP